MRIVVKIAIFLLVAGFPGCFVEQANAQSVAELKQQFLHPPASAKPWVFWYWMHGAVSAEGITADLEAMKSAGIGGAYLMPIKDTASKIPFQPTARQLTPAWWQLVKFAMQEAKRLNLQLAMHVSDGFALAGGPWITPALSMQKLVWTKTYVKGGTDQEWQLPQPEPNEGYYKDIAVYAYPANSSYAFSDKVLIPSVTTSNGTKAAFLSFPDEDNKQSFRSDTTCWIQYKYPEPFTCRSIRIHTGGNNYQAQRLIIQASNDGEHFNTICRLQPPRHGWQDADEDYTNAIPATTATHFRFVYDKEGSEPGAEDLDAAKWKPSFKVMGIYLSDEPFIHQYEAKNGSIWRIAAATTTQQVNDSDAVPLDKVQQLTGKMDSEGNLHWTAPPGNWVVLRIGHTSTGHTNATGGAGRGLECDKFNADAITLQFNNWFAQAFEKTDHALAKEVLKIFHVDSWECGSQNWTDSFPAEFKKRRGYNLMPYLPAMAGIPVENAVITEKFLHDVRQTIAELVNDVFYVTLQKLAHAKGCAFSAEAIAPTMVSDGILHYKQTDLPMGEFWLNSPTHDKPNDMLDAISGAHVYGKTIVQAEAFTTVRMNWGEHPGNLKITGDRNFALGINKMVLHVFTHNPWMNRKPGMTLDGIGLYYQRDQTWFKQSKAWIDYLTRCQALLQAGTPVADLAVFTGEELPRRAVLPDRLINTLPGIFGNEKLAKEKKRLENKGQPMTSTPGGVNHSANMAYPENWIDALNGYAYDSFNPDALTMARVQKGRIVLPGGASYALLVLPGGNPMQPNDQVLSLEVAKKLLGLVKDGATVLMSKEYKDGVGMQDDADSLRLILNQLFDKRKKKGKIIWAPYEESSFQRWGVSKDVEVLNSPNTGNTTNSIAWTHRKTAAADLYFISNQRDSAQSIRLSFRITGMTPELWDPVTGESREVPDWNVSHKRTFLSINLAPAQSVFIVFQKGAAAKSVRKTTPNANRKITANTSRRTVEKTTKEPTNETAFPENLLLDKHWTIQWDTSYGGPGAPVTTDTLKSWSQYADTSIKYYSGIAIYRNTFSINNREQYSSASIVFDSIFNIATVKVNGMDCGTLWTKPYSLDITKALKNGENKLEIEVANTWHNRLIGDQRVSPERRVTWTTAPFRLNDKPLLPAGLVGKVMLSCSK